MKALLLRKFGIATALASFVIMLIVGLAVHSASIYFGHEPHRSFRQVFITAVLYGIVMGWAGPWARKIDENRLARRAKK